jgi:hypothetical protein
MLDKIGSNQNMSAVSKIQSSFLEISKYCNHMIKRREKESETTFNDVHQIRELFKQFLIGLSISLTGTSVTFDGFFEKPNS